jgi:hypothetical protein
VEAKKANGSKVSSDGAVEDGAAGKAVLVVGAFGDRAGAAAGILRFSFLRGNHRSKELPKI